MSIILYTSFLSICRGMSVRRCFRFSKVLAVLFTVYVSERYLDNRPVFRQTKTVRLFLFFTCGHFGEPGFTPQAARCTVSCKIPVSEHRETGICSCLLQSNPCEIFLCFAKAFGLRSTLCCKQQCYAFVRQIAQSLTMSAALDFRKCKRLLLSSLAVSPGTGVHTATPCCDFSKSQ